MYPNPQVRGLAYRRVVRQWRAISFVTRDEQGGKLMETSSVFWEHTVVAAQIATRVEGAAAVTAAAVSAVQ